MRREPTLEDKAIPHLNQRHQRVDVNYPHFYFKDRVASEFAQCQVSGQMSGKMRYSLQTWPRRAARAGGPPRVPGGPAGGPRPRVRPQPPAASPPQVVWESSDAETLTYLSLRHSALGVHLQNVGKIPRFRPAGPDRGRFGGTERQSGRFLGVAPLPHHLGG